MMFTKKLKRWRSNDSEFAGLRGENDAFESV